jgi:hypothetical protein
VVRAKQQTVVKMRATVPKGAKVERWSRRVEAKDLTGVDWKGWTHEAVGLESCTEIDELVGSSRPYDNKFQYKKCDTEYQSGYLLLNWILIPRCCPGCVDCTCWS